ncbi:hypothetical protein D9B38_00810 [Corynebacterium diphtheriae]|nr:hypothetical protein D9B38_00810 [Corynebacterium diphtheriae]RKX00268.1 hypothetical protein D9B96_01015 [Corynebacterium diphtheriae]
MIFRILLILFSVRRFCGRLEELFDFDDDYAPLQQTWTYYQQAPPTSDAQSTHSKTGSTTKRGYFEGFFSALHTKSQENRPFEQIWCEVPSFRG